jgi:hypothetical protein
MYKSRGSLNFDLIRTKIFKERQQDQKHDWMIYLIYSLIGVSVGVVTWLITVFTNDFAVMKDRITSDLMGGQNDMVGSFFFFWFFSSSLAFIAVVLVVYFAP